MIRVSFPLRALAAIAVAATAVLTGCSFFQTGKTNFTVSGEFLACPTDSIKIFIEAGESQFKQLAAAKVEESEGKMRFSLSGKLPAEKALCYIGSDIQNARIIVLGAENDVKISGNCADFRSATIENSPLNAAYDRMLARQQQLFQEVSGAYQAVGQLQMAANQQGVQPDPKAMDAARANFLVVAKRISIQQKSVFDSLQKAEPYLSKIFALNIFSPFDPENPGTYTDELAHYAGTAMQYTNVADPDYAYIPQFRETISRYTATLFQQKPELAATSFDALLAKAEKGSLNHRVMLTAAIDALVQANVPDVATYAQQYLDVSPNLAANTKEQYQNLIAQAQPMLKARAITAIGAVAPEISLPTPDGRQLKLSQLRGKIVMLDFWASWCRPCRAENPNVVRLYKQYQSQGFEVLGISLDQTRDAWVQAIAADKLAWQHVSDLQYWKSAAAQTYGVSAIPQTFLLDREGKIIAKNLRGEELARKLAEIFKK